MKNYMKTKNCKGISLFIIAGILGTAVVLTGCGKRAKTTGVDSGERIITEECLVNGGSDVDATTEEGAESDWRGDNPRKSGYEGTEYTWNEMTIVIPDAWKDKYVLQEYEDGRGFGFLQKASDDKEKGMGYLCGFHVSEGPVFEMAGERQMAYTDDQMYYLTVPTDVSFYYEDEAISQEYQAMVKYIISMSESVQIAKKDVHYNPREYAIAMSDCYPLQENDMINFNDNELWIARNEIFARHGLEFKNTYLQEYFDACSWYQGTVTSDQFDDGVLSGIEKSNLELIEKAESEYKNSHPYPKMEVVGEETGSDLDENGSADTISYQVTEVAKDDYVEYEESFTINGVEYNLGGYEIIMENPEMENYYITDISPYFPGLEIAVMDHGPSDDPVTYFFTYDGSKAGKEALHYLGAVEGFPFKEMGNFNGFTEEGSVKGVIRTDIINTCYGYAHWWYDYDNKRLEYQETGYYPMLPSGAHELYVDLPVYSEMNTDSVQSTVAAQKQVYFILTDGREWIQVRGKDGSSGLVHIIDGQIDGLGKKPGEVFSNLQFYD
ncbi:MAG: YARHG domain-containing protein [Lachnospiraceae bacterium]|nr:YARHG domain-containing protein [Lachnospiraceae bacterium]